MSVCDEVYSSVDGVESCTVVFLTGGALFTYSDSFAAEYYRLALKHSDRLTS